MHQRVTIVYGVVLFTAFVVQFLIFESGEDALKSLGLRSDEFRIHHLLTYSFLHLRPGHLIINLAIIAFFGAYLETRIGIRRLGLVLVIAPVVAGLSHLAFAGDDPRALHGASGTAFALTTAAILVSAARRGRPRTGAALVVIVLAATGGAAIFTDPSGVSHAAHFGGALSGALLASRCLANRPRRRKRTVSN